MKPFLATLLVAGTLLMIAAATPAPAPKWKISKKANAVIEAKCYGCHSEEGRSDKAKAKLRWDEMEGLSASMQVEKLDAILNVLADRSMPPARMLEHNPDMALTDEDVEAMEKWASKLRQKLSR